MSFNLRVDLASWQRHLDSYHLHHPGLVPVIKGNGYGVGRSRLIEQATRMVVDTIAVGVAAEAKEALTKFTGSVLVLAPWQIHEVAAGSPDRLIRTVSSLPVLQEVAQRNPATPIIVELDSPMHRHGISQGSFEQLGALLPQLNCRGFAVHLPPIGNRLAATQQLLAALAAATIAPGTLWISHLEGAELTQVRAENPGLNLRPRVGTALWLGNRRSLTARGQVLDAHPITARTAVGYRQRRVSRGGSVIVVSGGTAHGVGLRSPASGRGLIGRLRGLASDLLQSTNHPPSPFSWNGHRLRYADVPHMQVSMLLVPHRISPPPIGHWLDCEVRLTSSSFDQVDLSVDLSTKIIGG